MHKIIYNLHMESCMSINDVLLHPSSGHRFLTKCCGQKTKKEHSIIPLFLFWVFLYISSPLPCLSQRLGGPLGVWGCLRSAIRWPHLVPPDSWGEVVSGLGCLPTPCDAPKDMISLTSHFAHHFIIVTKSFLVFSNPSWKGSIEMLVAHFPPRHYLRIQNWYPNWS